MTASQSLAADSTRCQFRTFCVLWAVAALFHMAHSSVFDNQLNFALLTLTAFYVIAKPRVSNLMFLAALQIFDAFYRMPYTTNHWLFTAFVNVTLIQAFICKVIVNRSFTVSESEFFRAFVPLVRVEVIILYFFAVFHKLNAGFFTPVTSCAFDLLQAQHLESIIPFSETFYKWSSYFTLAVELMIPVLLCIPATRLVAIVSGIVFHGVLAFSSYNAFYDFSSMIFAVYFLFTGPELADYITGIRSKIRVYLKEFLSLFSFTRLIIVATALFSGAAVIVLFNPKLNSSKNVHLAFWSVYCLVVLAVVITFLFKGRAARQHDKYDLVHWSFVIVPIIVFLNGMSPYLGLKTENSYAMFSNLRTEGGVSNHFIMPAGLQVFNFQKDVVKVISSSDMGLQDLADRNKALVLFEFKRQVQLRKPERVDYLLNGKYNIYQRADRGTHVPVSPNSFILNKLMRFRSFKTTEPQPCSH